MISNGKSWHYLAVKSLSRLLRGISSNHNSDYYPLNCFNSYRLKLNLMSIKKYVKIMNIVIQKCLVLIII